LLGCLNFGRDAPRRVLCIGAHCDDIEIGCGGLLIQLASANNDTHFDWHVFSGDDARKRETQLAASLIHESARVRVTFHGFTGSYFPSEGREIKERFESLKSEPDPDLVLTHYLNDRHQDHRLLSEFTWNTFRSHQILEYEIPKYEGDLGQPNVFVPLSATIANRKAAMLRQAFASQHARQWFDDETFLGLMRLRGVECASDSGYAEAFHGRKIVLAARSALSPPTNEPG
jgi:LmbE family N-acetylglucosaminyl deacetylase